MPELNGGLRGLEKFSQELRRRIQLNSVRQAGRADVDRYRMYVRLLRTRLGMSRTQLSEKAHVDRQLLMFLENGLMPFDELPIDAKEKIEAALGCSYEKFLYLNAPFIDGLVESEDPSARNQVVYSGEGQEMSEALNESTSGCVTVVPPDRERTREVTGEFLGLSQGEGAKGDLRNR